MARNMRWLSALLLGFWFLGFLQACRKENEVDPGFGPNGEPRVLAVQIPDIPTQNITINQDTKQILVTVPTSFSARFVYPALTLTPGTTDQSRALFFDPLEDNNQHPLFIRTGDNKINIYTYVLKPAGNLSFGAASGPLSFSLTDQYQYICLPIYNFLDEQPLSNVTLSLTHKATGERVILTDAVFGRETMCDKNTRTDGAIMVMLGLAGSATYYRPGEYTFTLAKSNGRTVTLTQPIQLASAATAARFNVDYTLKLNSGDYLLYGTNVYRDDKVSVRIQGRGQSAITVDALGFVDKRPGIRLHTALNLKPGYYYAQLLVNGIPTASAGRISISNQDHPLVLESLSQAGQATYKNLLEDSYSINTPITLRKETGYAINANYYLFTQNDTKPIKQVQLTSLADPSKVYTVIIGKDQYGSSDQLILPGTLPTGLYQLATQIIRSDGTEIDSIPTERDILIQ